MTDTPQLDPNLLQARLENLEKQLFQFASKGHRTMFRQTEEAAPLAKLEATLRLLDSEFQQFRGTDPKKLVEALVTQLHANFRTEIEERLATRASEEELLQFMKDIHRIESFTRETQINVFSLKSKLESLGVDLESRFTEQRWKTLETALVSNATTHQETVLKELRNAQKQQEEQVETKLKGVQSLLTLLEKEVRTQYGPEMLQEHMKVLEQGLATTLRSSIQSAQEQLQAKVSSYEGQSQQLRQMVLEAVADIKQELQGAALSARFQAYEDRLAEQEQRYKVLGQQYSQLEAHLKRQTEAAQERQTDLYQELEQTQAHIKELDSKANQAQQQVAASCAKWLKEREKAFDAAYGQTEAILTSLQSRTFTLEDELGTALEKRKRYEDQWKEQYSSLQKALEDKFQSWTEDKSIYVSTRVVELTQQIQSAIQVTKLQQRQVDKLLSEDVIQQFVSAVESKLRLSQNEWMQRRNTEITQKLEEYSKKLDTIYLQLDSDKQRIKYLNQKISQTSTSNVQKTPSTIPNQGNSATIYKSLTKCLYTAVFAEPGQAIDTLAESKPPPGWDAICFTNQMDLKANGWTILYMPIQQKNAILQAKYVKWNSHTLLEDYDVAVWMDAYLAPNAASYTLLPQWISQAYTSKIAIIHRRHDIRTCVWDECKAVLEGKRDTPEHVAAVRTRLQSTNMPKQFGLFDTNLIVRFHKRKECQEISDAIWSALQVDTHRDQLVVTPVYYSKQFTGFATLPLQQAFDRAGVHVRIPATQ